MSGGLSFTHVIMPNSYDMVAFKEILEYGAHRA